MRNYLVLGVSIMVAGLALAAGTAQAANYPPQQESGSIGLEGKISTEPPKQGATITTPNNGAVFTTLPITINGLCPQGLLVKVFSNNVFIGSANCTNGNYSIQTDLFNGVNQLVARVYDSLDQSGPDSNTVAVTFNSPQFQGDVEQLFLTSIYARRGAPPSSEILWPIILTGGIGPYAISVDWGDNSTPDLQSQSFAGTFNIKHTYKNSGIYKVVIKVTDSKGNVALLQVSAIATGAVSKVDSSKEGSATVVKTIVIWWPLILMVPLIVAAYWLGRRSELYSLRKTLENSRK
ncbi:MAG: Fibronectin type protein [Candidatus Saccharibacteria bacterium]|nr:Fibronectin type protein [Candidatus Saccharibacteria bacterium]